MDFKLVYGFTIGKFVFSSLSTSAYYFGFCFKEYFRCMLQFHISHLSIKGSAYCLDCKNYDYDSQNDLLM